MSSSPPSVTGMNSTPRTSVSNETDKQHPDKPDKHDKHEKHEKHDKHDKKTNKKDADVVIDDEEEKEKSLIKKMESQLRSLCSLTTHLHHSHG